MMNWIVSNGATIVVSLLLIGLFALIINKLYRDKKKGISTCGNACSGCAISGTCKGNVRK